MMKKELTRRSFLMGSALAAAGMAAGALTGCTSTGVKGEGSTVPIKWVPSEPESWDYEAEMVVCGCGIGGGCAMIEAHDLGLKVMGIEKSNSMREFAACTWSGGSLCGAGTEHQAASGIPDDNPEDMKKDIQAAGDELGDPELIDAWCKLSGETIDWLMKRCGCQVLDGIRPSEVHITHSRNHNSKPEGSGYGWMVGIENTVKDLGIPVLMETAVTKVHRAANGRVIGVEAKDLNTGKTINVKATKGVLLAMGGYGSNMDVWKYYSPVMKDIMKVAKKVSTSYPYQISGDGYHMLDDLDAYQYPGQSLYGCANVVLDDLGNGDAGILPHRWSKYGAIWLNQEGNRWGNESTFRDYYVTRSWRYITKMVYYMLFDDDLLKSKNGQLYAQPIIDTCTKSGYTKSVYSANTIEEVAEYFDIPGDQAAKTVAEWNEIVTTGGKDPVSDRTEMGAPILKPPFHILEITVSVGTSKAGTMITPKAEVLDNDRKVIPGLYACGEMASQQCHGSARQHISGGCNSTAANFGRYAARAVAGVTDEAATASAKAAMEAGPTRTPEVVDFWDRAASGVAIRELAASGKYLY
ncbi:FAD-dependent oxidoreductase [Desulfitobacterium hafniense]|uniref:Putative fumarate reductase flavoprotein subunit n=1 Tax=Desulfitobacterium hafniense (strain Y51) TaxID=138119 RepID=Q24Z70_DESHY|nr:FAD-binding protein [Desulfitobacterium hafniense]BAE82672.1 putative fumarate reductase flavoprotein subunit [Desulfitobacterium hafniense Y51]